MKNTDAQPDNDAPGSIEQLLKAMRSAIRMGVELARPTALLIARYRDLMLPTEAAVDTTYAETIRRWAFGLIRVQLTELDPCQLSKDKTHKKRDLLRLIKIMALCRNYNLANDAIDRQRSGTISGEDLAKLYAKPEAIWDDWQRLTGREDVVLNTDERKRVMSWLRGAYNARSDAWNTRVREGMELIWGMHARTPSDQIIKPRKTAKTAGALDSAEAMEATSTSHLLAPQTIDGQAVIPVSAAPSTQPATKDNLATQLSKLLTKHNLSATVNTTPPQPPKPLDVELREAVEKHFTTPLPANPKDRVYVTFHDSIVMQSPEETARQFSRCLIVERDTKIDTRLLAELVLAYLRQNSALIPIMLDFERLSPPLLDQDLAHGDAVYLLTRSRASSIYLNQAPDLKAKIADWHKAGQLLVIVTGIKELNEAQGRMVERILSHIPMCLVIVDSTVDKLLAGAGLTRLVALLQPTRQPGQITEPLAPPIASARAIAFDALSHRLRHLWPTNDDFVEAMSARDVVVIPDAFLAGLKTRLDAIQPGIDGDFVLRVACHVAYFYVYHEYGPDARFQPETLYKSHAVLQQECSVDKFNVAVSALVRIGILGRDRQGHYSFADGAEINLLASVDWLSANQKRSDGVVATRPRFYGAIALMTPMLGDSRLLELFETIWLQYFPASSRWPVEHIQQEQTGVVYAKTTAQVLGWCVASLSPVAQMYAGVLIEEVANQLYTELRDDLTNPRLTSQALRESVLLLTAISPDMTAKLKRNMALFERDDAIDRRRLGDLRAHLQAHIPWALSKRWLIEQGVLRPERDLMAHALNKRVDAISAHIHEWHAYLSAPSTKSKGLLGRLRRSN